MNFNYKQYIPANFSDSSRVWIYQGSRSFLPDEITEIKNTLHEFVAGWKSHGAAVKGFAGLFFDQFIVLMADESNITVGGCSTDSSVHLVQSIEQMFKVQLLERQILAFVVNEKIALLPLSELDQAVENNFIHANTLYFDNTVLTKKGLLEKWIISIKDCWLAKRIRFPEKI